MSPPLADTFPQRAHDMAALGGLAFFGGAPGIEGRDPVLAFPRPVGEAAAVAMALAGDAAAEVWRRRTGKAQRPRVSVRAGAAAIAGYAYQLLTTRTDAVRDADWEAEQSGWRAWGASDLLAGRNATNPAVGIYRTADGRWFHVHGGLPHLAERICAVLACAPAGIPAAIAGWTAEELEDALAAAGTCGAIVREAGEWRRHPQGALLAELPVVDTRRTGDAPPVALPGGAAPLAGLRVLELGTALAGPACGRTLAQFGAEVLQIVPPDRPDRQPFEMDTGHGKRSATLDLRDDAGRRRLADLIRGADVLVQGYRTGALDRLGFGAEAVAALSPGIVQASINCYGPVGDWAARRGWEGLAQATTGLTVPQTGDAPPRLVPGSVCDYLTGYLAARGVMAALLRRSDEGGGFQVRASLCQTGMWIAAMGEVPLPPDHAPPGLFEDLLVEGGTPFGHLRHLPPVPQLDGTPPCWHTPPPLKGSDPAAWQDGPATG